MDSIDRKIEASKRRQEVERQERATAGIVLGDDGKMSTNLPLPSSEPAKPIKDDLGGCCAEQRAFPGTDDTRTVAEADAQIKAENAERVIRVPSKSYTINVNFDGGNLKMSRALQEQIALGMAKALDRKFTQN